MYGIKLIQYANNMKFKSYPYVPVACCSVHTKDVLTYAGSGLYKFVAPHSYDRVGDGSLTCSTQKESND